MQFFAIGGRLLFGELDADDVAEVQVVDREVRGDRGAQIAELLEHRAEEQPGDERARGPRQVRKAGADVEEREDHRRREQADPGEERPAKQELLTDGARQREDEDVARAEGPEETAEAPVETARPLETVNGEPRHED